MRRTVSARRKQPEDGGGDFAREGHPRRRRTCQHAPPPPPSAWPPSDLSPPCLSPPGFACGQPPQVRFQSRVQMSCVAPNGVVDPRAFQVGSPSLPPAAAAACLHPGGACRRRAAARRRQGGWLPLLSSFFLSLLLLLLLPIAPCFAFSCQALCDKVSTARCPTTACGRSLPLPPCFTAGAGPLD